MKKAHSKRLSIPCLYVPPTKDIEPKPKIVHSKKFSSGKSSPNSTEMGRIKKLAFQSKNTTRQSSPLQTPYGRNSPLAAILKPKVPSHVIKPKKIIKKRCKPEEKLVELDGKPVKFAPKIFANQLFLDVYDEQGRHDRLMQVDESFGSESTHSPIIFIENLPIPNFEDDGPKPPGNSFEDTCQDSYKIKNGKNNLALLEKLELLAKGRNDSS